MKIPLDPRRVNTEINRVAKDAATVGLGLVVLAVQQTAQHNPAVDKVWRRVAKLLLEA